MGKRYMKLPRSSSNDKTEFMLSVKKNSYDVNKSVDDSKAILINYPSDFPCEKRYCQVSLESHNKLKS